MNDLLPDLYERKSARMRLLVVSDSHGDSYALYRAIQQQPAAQVVIHLGDGENDMEQAMGLCGEKRVICVRGNCDWAVSWARRCISRTRCVASSCMAISSWYV